MSTRHSLPRYDAPEAVVQLAGAWLARKDRGFNAAEVDEFNCWVRAHPTHAAAIAQLERTMSAFDRLRELAPAAAKPDRDYFAPPRNRRRWRLVAVTGLAAAIAVAVWLGRDAPVPAHWQYATPAGGYDRAILGDGSIIELNTDTAVEVAYTPGERRVRLTRGEAHFHVAKDSSRPFVVHANAVSVSAVGTAFNVRLATTGVEVLVTEGRVRVAPPSPPDSTAAHPASSTQPEAEIPLLSAGQRVVVPTDTRAEPTTIAEVSQVEMQRRLAWQMRVAEFSKTPLSLIVADFNRQNRQQIVIHDPELGALRIGGNFRVDQPEAFVRLLENGFGIKVERSGEVITLRKAPAESP